jgi:hypothetical protein
MAWTGSMYIEEGKAVTTLEEMKAAYSANVSNNTNTIIEEQK